MKLEDGKMEDGKMDIPMPNADVGSLKFSDYVYSGHVLYDYLSANEQYIKQYFHDLLFNTILSTYEYT